ncbi:hypothetical protein [Actinophytocola sp.]|uniref:hypothetical protein n=1 Tax=Actinophytocola sp. TaxID=1872138 RepID=UPI00389B1CAB
MVDMLRARRRGFFRREYEVYADDTPVTVLTGARREGCEFTLSGAGFRVDRDGRRHFLLTGPDGRIATADRQSGREWTVRTAGGELTLAKPSIWRSDWEVRGAASGAIRQEGWFSRTYSADVPPDVPLPVAVFVLYVVLVIFERQASAAAGGAAAASAASG